MINCFYCLSWTFTTQDCYWSTWKLLKTRITRISYYRLFTSNVVYVLTDSSLLIHSFRMPQEIFLFFHFCMPYSEFMITRFLPDFSQLSLAFSIPALVLAFIILHFNSAKTPAVGKNIWSFFSFNNSTTSIWQPYQFYQLPRCHIELYHYATLLLFLALTDSLIFLPSFKIDLKRYE